MSTLPVGLPSLDDERRIARAVPKGLPHVLAREQKKQAKADQEEAFKAAVWDRDKGISRASDKPLKRAHLNPAKCGHVHHRRKRSTAPAEKYDPKNGVLLSALEHELAETRCPANTRHFLLDIYGPADSGQVLTFVKRDAEGREIWRRQS